MALSKDTLNRLAYALGSFAAGTELANAIQGAAISQQARAPVDGVNGDVGFGFAQDTSQAPYVSYINVGTIANPTWQKIQTGDVI